MTQVVSILQHTRRSYEVLLYIPVPIFNGMFAIFVQHAL